MGRRLSAVQQKPSRVLVVTHPFRRDVAERAERIVAALRQAGVAARILAGDVRSLDHPDALMVADEDSSAAADIVLALGGDGTVLRSAKMAAESDVPLLGVNFGKVGFLAEAETGELDTVVSRLLEGDYTVEERTTLAVEAAGADGERTSSWAFNDIAVEKAEPARMLELCVEIDGSQLSRYGCDGVLCATPTGSTAHAMSAGGPVVWPDVDALVVVPMNAHALFAKPMVVHSSSVVHIGVESIGTAGALIADGKEIARLTAGSTVAIRRSPRPVKLVRMSERSFSSRLVSKLSLPVNGWRHGRT